MPPLGDGGRRLEFHVMDVHKAPNTDLSEGEICKLLGYQLAQAEIVTTKLFNQTVGKKFEIKPVELTILELLRANADASPSALAKALSITMPSVTIWLDKLQEKGYIERKRSPDDKRVQQISITKTGSSIVGKCIRGLLDAEQRLLNVLTADEHATLIALSQKVRQVSV